MCNELHSELECSVCVHFPLNFPIPQIVSTCIFRYLSLFGLFLNFSARLQSTVRTYLSVFESFVILEN